MGLAEIPRHRSLGVSPREAFEQCETPEPLPMGHPQKEEPIKEGNVR